MTRHGHWTCVATNAQPRLGRQIVTGDHKPPAVGLRGPVMGACSHGPILELFDSIAPMVGDQVNQDDVLDEVSPVTHARQRARNVSWAPASSVCDAVRAVEVPILITHFAVVCRTMRNCLIAAREQMPLSLAQRQSVRSDAGVLHYPPG